MLEAIPSELLMHFCAGKPMQFCSGVDNRPSAKAGNHSAASATPRPNGPCSGSRSTPPANDLDRSPSLRGARKKGLNPRPFLVGQVARIPFGLLLDLGHSAARRWGPHPELESRPQTANRIQRLFKRTLRWPPIPVAER